jgi:hypothetical protein
MTGDRPGLPVALGPRQGGSRTERLAREANYCVAIVHVKNVESSDDSAS